MEVLERRILEDGCVLEGGVLRVDSFLNHQLDVALFDQMGAEWARLFAGEGITKILTVEASGIGIACVAARHFGVPVLFAKKNRSSNVPGGMYTARVKSYTHGKTYDIMVSRRLLLPSDRVLIIDDFLAAGEALAGLIRLVRDAGASVAGAGIAVEKAFQDGGRRIREMGVRVESLARIAAMDEGGIRFC